MRFVFITDIIYGPVLCVIYQAFPLHFQDFDVRHDLLLNNDPNTQVRIRKRGQRGYKNHEIIIILYMGIGYYMYTNTKRIIVNGEKMELIRQITRREYEANLMIFYIIHMIMLVKSRCY